MCCISYDVCAAQALAVAVSGLQGQKHEQGTRASPKAKAKAALLYTFCNKALSLLMLPLHRTAWHDHGHALALALGLRSPTAAQYSTQHSIKLRPPGKAHRGFEIGINR